MKLRERNEQRVWREVCVRAFFGRQDVDPATQNRKPVGCPPITEGSHPAKMVPVQLQNSFLD